VNVKLQKITVRTGAAKGPRSIKERMIGYRDGDRPGLDGRDGHRHLLAMPPNVFGEERARCNWRRPGAVTDCPKCSRGQLLKEKGVHASAYFWNRDG